MLKIRRPLGRLIFNMGIAIPGKTVFLIETAPWTTAELSSPITTRISIKKKNHSGSLHIYSHLAQTLIVKLNFEYFSSSEIFKICLICESNLEYFTFFKQHIWNLSTIGSLTCLRATLCPYFPTFIFSMASGVSLTGGGWDDQFTDTTIWQHTQRLTFCVLRFRWLILKHWGFFF